MEPTRGRGVQNMSHRDLDNDARAQKGVKSKYQYKQECESVTFSIRWCRVLKCIVQKSFFSFLKTGLNVSILFLGKKDIYVKY